MASEKRTELRVIGAGLPRTATTSLREALRILGFTNCHTFIEDVGKEFFPYRNSLRWQEALKSENKEVRQKLLRQIYESRNYDSAVDYPSALFLEDLVEMYPNAKFVHGIRSSPKAWMASVHNTIGQPIAKWEALICGLIPFLRISLAPVHAAFGSVTKQQFGVSIYDPTPALLSLYEQHNLWVKRVVPAERLLADFQPTQGWEPLCKFLDVPVPKDEQGAVLPFPHANDTGNMNKMFNLVKVIGLLHWVAAIGVTYGAVAYVLLPGVFKAMARW